MSAYLRAFGGTTTTSLINKLHVLGGDPTFSKLSLRDITARKASKHKGLGRWGTMSARELLFRNAVSKSITIILVLSMVGFVSLLSGHSQTAEPWQSQKLGPGQLLGDFNIFREALEQGHPGIYRYTAKPEMDRLFHDAELSLSHPMDAIEFYRKLVPIVAAVKCGHTGLALPSSLSKKFLLLPLRIQVMDGRIYIKRDLATPEAHLEGKEIASINGVSANKIADALLADAFGDGDIKSSREWDISGSNFNTSIIALLGLESPYKIVLRGKPSAFPPREMDGVNHDQFMQLWKTKYPRDIDLLPSPDPRLEFLDGGHIAIMKIPSFGHSEADAKRIDLRGLFKRSFAEINGRAASALILDLRDNGGGEDEIGKILFSYFADRPFKWYDDVILNGVNFDFLKYASDADPIPADLVQREADGKYHMTGHPNWGVHQPSEPHFTGKAYVLMNGRSFSTTSEFLSQMRSHRAATLIGEESAGGYYGNNSGFEPTITLPGSKLTLRVPLAAYYLAVEHEGLPSRGVLPDYPVKYSIQDELMGSDKDMEVALRLIRKKLH